MNERPIPEAAMLDKDSVEMLRVWIAGKRLHSSMKVGMYKETMNVPEESAWGRILADVARHIADALEEGYGQDREDSLTKIRLAFNKQLETPSTNVRGQFLKRH